MTQVNQEDLELVRQWFLIVLIIASICTTMFPILYVFNWKRSRFTWIIMLQSIALSLAIDLTLLFQIWRPDPIHFHDLIAIFVVNAIVMTMIAGTSLALTVMMWRLNHPKKENKHARRTSRGRNESKPPR